jgi:hypothetical protein
MIRALAQLYLHLYISSGKSENQLCHTQGCVDYRVTYKIMVCDTVVHRSTMKAVRMETLPTYAAGHHAH